MKSNSLAVVILLLLPIGCVQHVPITFAIKNAETAAPIAEAHVTATTRYRPKYPGATFTFTDFFGAQLFDVTGQNQQVSGFTGTDGRVRLDVPFAQDTSTINAEKPGHSFVDPHRGYISALRRDQIASTTQPIELTLPLYAESVHLLRVIVPEDFHGPILLDANHANTSKSSNWFCTAIISKNEPMRFESFPASSTFDHAWRFEGATYDQLHHGKLLPTAARMDRPKPYDSLGHTAEAQPEKGHPFQILSLDSARDNQMAVRCILAAGKQAVFFFGTGSEAEKFREDNGLLDPLDGYAMTRLFRANKNN